MNFTLSLTHPVHDYCYTTVRKITKKVQCIKSGEHGGRIEYNPIFFFIKVT